MGTNHDSVDQGDHPIGSGNEDVDALDGIEEQGEAPAGGDDSTGSDSDMDDDSDSDFSSDFSENGDNEGQNEAKKEEKEEDEEDEEDPVVKAIARAKEKKSSNHPPDLILDSIPSTLSFHPQNDQIVFGNYEGEIIMYGYSMEENVKVANCSHASKAAVRAITFTHDGEKLISCYSDQTIQFFDVRSGLKLEKTMKNATSAPVSSVYVIDEHMFATGDDDGNVKLWDNRSKTNATTSLRLGEDAITSMVTNDARRVLVCTSEEGAIYAIKIRAGKVQVESEIYNYEFNCSCVFKQDSKLAVGDGKGDVYIFNWDEFGKHSDLCTGIGRGEAINAMIPITEKIILTGGDDGFIRAFNFFPHKYLGVVGKIGHPVEKMDVCNDGHLVSSIGADETVKFWNVSYFENMTIPSGTSKETKESSKDGPKDNFKKGGQKQDLSKHNLPSSSHQNAADFFKGLVD